MITQRDLELFKKLSSYGMLTTKLVRELVFDSIATTTVLRRLRLLEDCSYVKRILGLESQEVLWMLTEKGAAEVGLELFKRNWSKNMLEHDYKLLNLRLLLERHGLTHSWKPEHEIRAMIFKASGFRAAKEKIIPDGLMGIETNGQQVSVAFELELTMKNSTRYDETFRKYGNKQNLHAIWYVAPNIGTVNQIYRRWKKIQNLWNVPRLYLSLLDEVMTNPLAARLMGDKCDRIKDVWTAHPPAQRVSSLIENRKSIYDETSSEDHTPLEKDSA